MDPAITSSPIHHVAPELWGPTQVGSLCRITAYTRVNQRIADLAECFLADPELPCCAILDADGALSGLLDRNHLFNQLGKSFGRAVLGKRPVSELAQALPSFEPKVSILQVSSLLLEQLKRPVHQHFAVFGRRNGYQGLFSSSDLLLYLHGELVEANRRLEALSRTDGLTGLLNRRTFDEDAVLAWKAAARSRSTLSVALLDVDYFKAYNDTYGHAAGDEALRFVAKKLRSRFRRSEDRVGRYGGEELVVCCPGLGADALVDLCRSLRADLVQAARPHQGSPIGRLTVSIGVASVVASKDGGLSHALELADQALYQAKSRGRDQVVRYSAEAG